MIKILLISYHHYIITAYYHCIITYIITVSSLYQHYIITISLYHHWFISSLTISWLARIQWWYSDDISDDIITVCLTTISSLYHHWSLRKANIPIINIQPKCRYLKYCNKYGSHCLSLNPLPICIFGASFPYAFECTDKNNETWQVFNSI